VETSVIVIAPNKTKWRKPQPAMNKITQDMKYRYSLVQYALSQGVGKAARKYNKGRSYIYFWTNRFDGDIHSLASRSRRPKHHPMQHSREEIELIRRYWSHNRELGLFELWFKLREQGYTRHYVSLYRVMRREGLGRQRTAKKTKYKPKPYEQMRYAGERVQVDVKVVPKACIQDEDWKRYYQYTAIDEFSRLRYLEAFQTADTFSSAVFIEHAATWFARKGIRIECVQTDNGFEFTKRFLKTRQDRNPSLFETVLDQKGIRHKLIKPYTPRHNGKVERSHKEDQKRLYDHARFFSFEDFRQQLRRHNQRTNKIPMRPLNFLSPLQFLNQSVQYV
jgi:transposase InsO family protein